MNPSSNHFGIIVAYLLPGFIGLIGIAPFVPTVSVWLHPSGYAEASVGPPVYAILAAITIGMLVSCVRWLFVDHVHWWTGLIPPVWDDRNLEQRLVAFNYLVESHYRYYQFVANSLVAVVWAYLVHRVMGTSPFLSIGTDVSVLVLCLILFAASRDALAKYYSRTGRVIGHSEEAVLRGEAMYNGNHHEEESGASQRPKPAAKPAAKPPPAPKPQQEKGKTSQSQK
jgi:hypothetical protein